MAFVLWVTLVQNFGILWKIKPFSSFSQYIKTSMIVVIILLLFANLNDCIIFNYYLINGVILFT